MSSYRLYEYDTDPTTTTTTATTTGVVDDGAVVIAPGPPKKEYQIRRSTTTTTTATTTMDSNTTVVALECVPMVQQQQQQHRLLTTTTTTTSLLLQQQLQQLQRHIGRLLADLLLPDQYPQSVRPGYFQYQWYDSLQGLCSYLRNIVCSAALFQALAAAGGSSSMTASSSSSSSDDFLTEDTMMSSSSSSVRHTAWNAAVVWAIRDGTGLVGGLLYTYLISRYLDAFVKEFRLFADVINDVGFTLDMILPYIEHTGGGGNNNSSSSSTHSNLFWIVSSCSVLCKMMCGISAGATKSSITCHFAVQGNMADLNAKESTQETMVTLIGMVGGIYVAKFLQSLENDDDDGTTTAGGHDSRTVTWIFFIVLTAIHLYANYLGVSLLRLRTINTSRIDPCLQNLYATMVLQQQPWPVVTTTRETDRLTTPSQQQQQYDALHSLLSTTILSPTDIREIMFLPVWQFLGILPSSLIYCNTIPARQLAPYFHQSLLGQLLMPTPPPSHADPNDNIPFERTIQSLRYNVTIMMQGDNGAGRNTTRNKKPKVAITLLAGATSNDELQAYLHARIIRIRLLLQLQAPPSQSPPPQFDPHRFSDATASTSHILRRVLLESYDIVQQLFQQSPNRSETEPSLPPLIIHVLQQKDWDTSRFYFNYAPSRCQLVVGNATTDPNASRTNKKDD